MLREQILGGKTRPVVMTDPEGNEFCVGCHYDSADALGAREAQHQAGPEIWRVLIDPAGHPFCLTTVSLD